MFEKLEQLPSLYTGKFSAQQWTVVQLRVDALPDKTEQAAFRYDTVWSMLRKQLFAVTAWDRTSSSRV